MSSYTNATTTIDSKKVTLTRGVKQGDLLSPIILNSILNYIISHLSKELCYSFSKHHVPVLVLAYDMVILSSSPVALQATLIGLSLK